MRDLQRTGQQPVLYKESWFGRVWARPISLRVTWLLSSTRITANHITLLWLCAVFVACLLFMTGEYLYGVLGGIVIQIMFILDGVDGELARLRGPTLRGERLEAISHTITYALIPLSFGIGIQVKHGCILLLCLGFSASMSYMLASVQQLETEKLLAVHGVSDPGEWFRSRQTRDTSRKWSLSGIQAEIHKLAPLYPVSITALVVLNLTWLWIVLFFPAFLRLSLIWTNRHLEVAAFFDSTDHSF